MMDFVERHFKELALLLLALLLIAAHAFMLHAGRPAEMVHWAEGLITGVFTALIAMLANKGNGKPQ